MFSVYQTVDVEVIVDHFRTVVQEKRSWSGDCGFLWSEKARTDQGAEIGIAREGEEGNTGGANHERLGVKIV